MVGGSESSDMSSGALGPTPTAGFTTWISFFHVAGITVVLLSSICAVGWPESEGEGGVFDW